MATSSKSESVQVSGETFSNSELINSISLLTKRVESLESLVLGLSEKLSDKLCEKLLSRTASSFIRHVSTQTQASEKTNGDDASNSTDSRTFRDVVKYGKTFEKSQQRKDERCDQMKGGKGMKKTDLDPTSHVACRSTCNTQSDTLDLKRHSSKGLDTSKRNQTSSENQNGLDCRKQTQQSVSTVQKHAQMQNHVSEQEESSEKERKKEISAQEEKECLPTCWTLHDSVLNGIIPEQLGKSYFFHSTDMVTYRLEHISPTLKKMKEDLQIEGDPDAILIHCGVNNLRVSTTQTVFEDIQANIAQIREDFPNTKILWSEICQTSIRSLNIKAKLLNAQLAAELECKSYVKVIPHTLRATPNTMRNEIHPNKKGTSILAATIGRAIRNEFWTKAHGTHRSSRGSYGSHRGSRNSPLDVQSGQMYGQHSRSNAKIGLLDYNRYNLLSSNCSSY